MVVKITHSAKLISALSLGALFWATIVVTGTRLPLLHTEASFLIRIFVIFPVLLITLWYVLFVYRWRTMPESLYRMRMKHLSTKKEKVTAMLKTTFAALFMMGGLSWTSIAFPAWATELFASGPFSHVYQITDITYQSGAKWTTLFDLHLMDPDGSEATLLLNRWDYDQNHWKASEKICVVGRTWAFGTIATETTRSLDRCKRAQGGAQGRNNRGQTTV
jgi:hypothetical protein